MATNSNMANPYRKSDVHCMDCSNQLCFVQQFCSPTWLGIINECRNYSFFRKGEYIFHEGDRIFGLYFIQQGKVKVVSAGLNDRMHIVRLATDGHILGHRGLGAETYPVGAVTLEDSWVCFLDNASINDAFINNPKFTYELMMFYSAELRKTEMRLRYLAHMTMREKIAKDGKRIKLLDSNAIFEIIACHKLNKELVF